MGISAQSEGQIVASCLSQAIHKKSELKVFVLRKSFILDQRWISSSETVRLQFFLEFSEELKHSNENRCIIANAYIESPQTAIKDWFTCKVNSIQPTEMKNILSDLYDKESEEVEDFIRKCTEYPMLKEYIEEYCSKVEGFTLEYNWSAFDLMLSKNYYLFAASLVDKLRKKNCLNDPNKIDKLLPSEDNQIMHRLGCTALCPLCRSICWGYYGHIEDSKYSSDRPFAEKDKQLQPHFTCHQPLAFNGTTRSILEPGFIFRRKWLELDGRSCFNIQDNEMVTCSGNNAAPWADIKLSTNSWLFEAHMNEDYNKLMCWIYLNLNHRVAEKYNIYAVSFKELDKLGYATIGDSIDAILIGIRQRVS